MEDNTNRVGDDTKVSTLANPGVDSYWRGDSATNSFYRRVAYDPSIRRLSSSPILDWTDVGARIQRMRTLRSPVPVIGATLYLLAFVGAAIYPLFSGQTFSGLLAVMLAWPWIDYLPSWRFTLLIGVALNTFTIYCVLALFVAVFG